MTVNSEIAKQRYSGNGTTTNFSTVFNFLANSHVKVIITDATNFETTQIENTHYTLTGAGTNVAGNVHMLAAPLTGTFLTIIRSVPFTQEFNGEVLSTADAQDLEFNFDKIWMALGQLNEVDSRQVGSSPGSGAPPAGWVAELAVIVDGTREVLQVDDWFGGAGTKPDIGMYVGPTGFVWDIALAVDIRGIQGIQGIQGPIGPQGPQGIQGIQGPTGPGGAGSGDMLRSANLSDLISIPTARTNLGLGGAALLNVGTAAGTVAAGNDSRITGAAPLASPVFTGNPTGPTPTAGDNDTSLATTQFVTGAIATAVAAGPPAGSVDYADVASGSIATAAEYRNNTANKILTTDKVWSAGAVVTLTDGATVTPDFSTGFDFTWTIGAAGRTLANPTSPKDGQKGFIYLVQDGTGARTITTWGTNYKFAGGGKPTLSTIANSIDVLSYAVKSSTEIMCTFVARMF